MVKTLTSVKSVHYRFYRYHISISGMHRWLELMNKKGRLKRGGRHWRDKIILPIAVLQIYVSLFPDWFQSLGYTRPQQMSQFVFDGSVRWQSGPYTPSVPEY